MRRIADFIGVNLDDETIARVVQTTTHAEMVKHHSKFDNHSMVKACTALWGDSLTSALPVGRVRKDGGRSGDGRKLPLEVQRRIEQEWQDIITPKLGFNNLQEMREAWKNERKK